MEMLYNSEPSVCAIFHHSSIAVGQVDSTYGASSYCPARSGRKHFWYVLSVFTQVKLVDILYDRVKCTKILTFTLSVYTASCSYPSRDAYSKANKKKLLCCPHPTKIWKLGRSVGIFFFFFFTYRERVEFSNIFFKVSKWENSGGMQSKTHIQVMQVLFLSHWIQF